MGKTVKHATLPAIGKKGVGKKHSQDNGFAAHVLSHMVSAVVDSVSDGVFILQPRGHGYYIHHANRTMAGLLQTKLGGRLAEEVLPKEEWQRMRPLLRMVSRGCKTRCVRTSFQTLGGETHQIKLRLEPICMHGHVHALVGTVKMLTQSVKIQRENRQLRQRFAASFEHAPYGVCFVGMQHQPSLVNNAMAGMLGYMPHVLQNMHVEELIHEEDRAVFTRALEKVFMGERTYDGIEVRMLMENTRPIWVAMSLSLASHGSTRYAVMQTLDITLRKQNEAELLKLATEDHLTGVHNRLVFERRLKDAIINAQRYGRKGAVLFIDLDEFKTVNDSFGHKVGDAALKAVAQCVGGQIRATDTLARLGGDEFAAILEEANLENAQKKAEMLRMSIAALKIPLGDGRFLDVSASIGVKVFDGTDVNLSVEMITHAADRAMYRQKGLAKAEPNS